MLISSRSIWPVNRSLSRIIDTEIEPRLRVPRRRHEPALSS